MKTTTAFTKGVWESGDYVGGQRPMVRATIAKWHMWNRPYFLRWGDSVDWKHNGHHRSALFNQDGPIRELRNIKSIKWSRGIDNDVATCTIVLVNVHWLQDQANEREEEFDFPGWFTPNRGDTSRWDYDANEWKDWLIPDRVIKTWEGYGVDFDAVPEGDAHMYPSGVWLIDDVDFGADGIITLECRDLGRLLLDQLLFPPIVPHEIYPLSFSSFGERPQKSHVVPSGAWLKPAFDSDSNSVVDAAGLLDGTLPAVNPDTGRVHGHIGNQARDSDTDTFWLSAGSKDPNQLEWIQFTVDPETDITGVRLNVKGGPYKVYVSLYHATKGWRGGGTIRYEIADDGVDNHADIRYVKSFFMQAGEIDEFQLPRKYKHITKIRLTFASRWNSGIGQERVFRTALQELSYCTEHTVVPGDGNVTTGNYGDYTDIIKWLCSWCGLWWPSNAKMKTLSGKHDQAPAVDDDVLKKGAIWGDFEQTGLSGIAKLDVDMFDKKPVMDGISAVRDVIGFDFWIDEAGAAIWRMPNIWKRGNYLTNFTDYSSRPHTTEVVEIDERTTLIELSAKLSSRNVRERIMVTDVNGNFGEVVRGYNPAPTGMYRVAGWSDQHFRNRHETVKMANLIAIRQSFLYRQNTLTIAANPALQIDDQVVIYERMTGEGYLHRITGIDCEFDFESGKWTYQLTTHWLGEAAFTSRAWEPPLNGFTTFWLNQMGWRA